MFLDQISLLNSACRKRKKKNETTLQWSQSLRCIRFYYLCTPDYLDGVKHSKSFPRQFNLRWLIEKWNYRRGCLRDNTQQTQIGTRSLWKKTLWNLVGLEVYPSAPPLPPPSRFNDRYKISNRNGQSLCDTTLEWILLPISISDTFPPLSFLFRHPIFFFKFKIPSFLFRPRNKRNNWTLITPLQSN